MEKARGHSLAALRLSQPDQETLLHQVGQALRQLHTVQVDGFGWLDETHYRQTGRVRGHAPTWRAALLHTAPDSLDYLQHVGALTGQQVDRARPLIKKQSALLDDSSGGRLLHGDLGPIHIWVDEPQKCLTSIVDFGERSAGDPVWDFVDYDWKAVPAILEGYEPNAAMRELFDRKFYLFALLRAIPWACRWHQRGAVQVVDWLSLVIREASERLSADT
jgi:aminoglycoside phosphotransferase (APT) family kinase protein